MKSRMQDGSEDGTEWQALVIADGYSRSGHVRVKVGSLDLPDRYKVHFPVPDIHDQDILWGASFELNRRRSLTLSDSDRE
jgi:hypothetical protein